MSNNPFKDWTLEMVAEHNRRVASGRSGSADIVERFQRESALNFKQTAPVPPPVKPVTSPALPKQARRGEWVEIGGKRRYMRSKWEIRYCAYLQFLKDHGFIRDYDYEPRTFWFDGIRRGVTNYKPDFFVTLNDGREQYREVKGFMDKKSATKLKRMAKYYPEIDIIVIDSAWFKANSGTLSRIVPGWSKKK